MATTTTSCPHCGSASAAGAAQCRNCGFVFFEEPRRRELPRPSGRALLALGGTAAAIAVAVALIARDPPPVPPQPVSAQAADRRLEARLASDRFEDGAAVACGGAISTRRSTRCQVRYRNGDTQLLLVSLDAEGELAVMVPYPAQRRPGD